MFSKLCFPIIHQIKFQQILLNTNTFFWFSLYFLDSSSVTWQFIKFFFANFWNFFSKFQQILLKTNTFFQFSLYFLDSFSVPYWHFIKFFFANFSKFFLKIHSRVSIKLQLKFAQNFYSSLHDFLAIFEDF